MTTLGAPIQLGMLKDVDEVKKLMRARLGALGALHASGIVHRDVRLENFLQLKTVDGALRAFVLMDRELCNETGQVGRAAGHNMPLFVSCPASCLKVDRMLRLCRVDNVDLSCASLLTLSSKRDHSSSG